MHKADETPGWMAFTQSITLLFWKDSLISTWRSCQRLTATHSTSQVLAFPKAATQFPGLHEVLVGRRKHQAEETSVKPC